MPMLLIYQDQSVELLIRIDLSAQNKYEHMISWSKEDQKKLPCHLIR